MDLLILVLGFDGGGGEEKLVPMQVLVVVVAVVANVAALSAAQPPPPMPPPTKERERGRQRQRRPRAVLAKELRARIILLYYFLCPIRALCLKRARHRTDRVFDRRQTEMAPN